MPVPVPRSNILVCPSLVLMGALCSLSPRAFSNKECPMSRWNVSSCWQLLSGRLPRINHVAQAYRIAGIHVLVSSVSLILSSVLVVSLSAWIPVVGFFSEIFLTFSSLGFILVHFLARSYLSVFDRYCPCTKLGPSYFSASRCVGLAATLGRTLQRPCSE